jgi:hypothetical protein
MRSIALTFILATLAACSTASTVPCGSGQQSSVQELLYFGREKPGGQVSAEEWAEFLNDTVTPRFPAGLSSWQASGQWQSASGALVREPSYVLSVVRPDDTKTETAVREIVTAYKSRFEQEAVLRVTSHACISL